MKYKKQNLKKESFEFTDKEVEIIKSIIEDKNFVQDNDKLIESINKSISESDLELAKKVIQCYDILDTNSFQFKNEEKDLSKKMFNFIKKFNISELRSLITEYGDGTSYGSYVLGEKIKRNINLKRDNYMELIKFFLRIFSEGD